MSVFRQKSKSTLRSLSQAAAWMMSRHVGSDHWWQSTVLTKENSDNSTRPIFDQQVAENLFAELARRGLIVPINGNVSGSNVPAYTMRYDPEGWFKAVADGRPIYAWWLKLKHDWLLVLLSFVVGCVVTALTNRAVKVLDPLLDGASNAQPNKVHSDVAKPEPNGTIIEAARISEHRIVELEQQKSALEQRMQRIEQSTRQEAEKRDAQDIAIRAKEAELQARDQADRLARQELLASLDKAKAELASKESGNRDIEVQIGSDAANMAFTRIVGLDGKQVLVNHANSALRNIGARVTTDGHLCVSFDADIEALKKIVKTDLVGWMSFQFSLFDKNGQYLTHLSTKERFAPHITEKGIRTIIKISPQSGATLATERMLFVPIKDVKNELMYGVNLRDLKETHAVKVGVILHSQYDP